MVEGHGDPRLPWLLCRAGSFLCALPLEQVVEVMRPLPAQGLDGAPPCLRGLAVIRGDPVPVIDLARLLGRRAGTVARFVTARAGDRILALAVAEILGLRGRRADGAAIPLLRRAARDSVTAIGALDAEALLFLSTLKLLPEESVR